MAREHKIGLRHAPHVHHDPVIIYEWCLGVQAREPRQSHCEASEPPHGAIDPGKAGENFKPGHLRIWQRQEDDPGQRKDHHYAQEDVRTPARHVPRDNHKTQVPEDTSHGIVRGDVIDPNLDDKSEEGPANKPGDARARSDSV